MTLGALDARLVSLVCLHYGVRRNTGRRMTASDDAYS